MHAPILHYNNKNQVSINYNGLRIDFIIFLDITLNRFVRFTLIEVNKPVNIQLASCLKTFLLVTYAVFGHGSEMI